MTAPRAVYPGRFLFITRRCTQRQYLLRPDAATNNAFIYCLGVAVQRFKVCPILVVMMSNHYHAIIYDPFGQEVEFRAYFNSLMSRSQNALRGRWENMWSTTEPCTVELISTADLMDKLVYVATNPVEAGLVDTVHHWPGPNFLGALLRGKPLKAHRPNHFFREEGPMPATVELVMQLPENIPNHAEFLAELRRRVTEAEESFARERMSSNRRVVGRQGVLRQSWRDNPKTHEPRRVLIPRVAARDKWRRIAALQRNHEWDAEYRAAYEKYRAGLPAEFPYGTYWLKRFANVSVKPPPVVA